MTIARIGGCDRKVINKDKVKVMGGGGGEGRVTA